jgi:pyruvate formate lyase activating enzyme
VVDDVARYATFLRRAGGGLTVSGGEPLVQAAFVGAMFSGAKALGLHTAIDTSGYGGDRAPDALLDVTDLVLLDIKAWSPDTYRHVTGVELASTLAFARRLAERGTPVWLRYVLVPGLTDAATEVEGVAAFAAELGNVRRVDVLPFHQMGAHKWERLGLAYTLHDVAPPTTEQVAAAVARFRVRGLRAA